MLDDTPAFQWAFFFTNFWRIFYVEHDYTLPYIHRRDVCRRCSDVSFAGRKA